MCRIWYRLEMSKHISTCFTDELINILKKSELSDTSMPVLIRSDDGSLRSCKIIEIVPAIGPDDVKRNLFVLVEGDVSEILEEVEEVEEENKLNIN